MSYATIPTDLPEPSPAPPPVNAADRGYQDGLWLRPPLWTLYGDNAAYRASYEAGRRHRQHYEAMGSPSG